MAANAANLTLEEGPAERGRAAAESEIHPVVARQAAGEAGGRRAAADGGAEDDVLMADRSADGETPA